MVLRSKTWLNSVNDDAHHHIKSSGRHVGIFKSVCLSFVLRVSRPDVLLKRFHMDGNWGMGQSGVKGFHMG